MSQAVRKEAIRRQREWEEASRSARRVAMRRTIDNRDKVKSRVQTGIQRFLISPSSQEETCSSSPQDQPTQNRTPDQHLGEAGTLNPLPSITRQRIQLLNNDPPVPPQSPSPRQSPKITQTIPNQSETERSNTTRLPQAPTATGKKPQVGPNKGEPTPESKTRGHQALA